MVRIRRRQRLRRGDFPDSVMTECFALTTVTARHNGSVEIDRNDVSAAFEICAGRSRSAIAYTNDGRLPYVLGLVAALYALRSRNASDGTPLPGEGVHVMVDGRARVGEYSDMFPAILGDLTVATLRGDATDAEVRECCRHDVVVGELQHFEHHLAGDAPAGGVRTDRGRLALIEQATAEPSARLVGRYPRVAVV